MKLQILQEDFSKAVAMAARFTSSRAQLPILNNILMSASKTKFSLMSTNLEVSVAVHIGAKVEEEGSVSVPSRVIADLVTNLPKETLNLNSQKEKVEISAQGFSSSLLGVDATDFPKIPSSIQKEKSILIPKDDFAEAISQTVFASSFDEARPILTGVLFVFGENSLSLVATDGFRLSRKETKVQSQSVKSGLKTVVPKTVLQEVLRTLSEGEDVFFRFDEKDKQVVFGSNETVISSRLIEGEYPDYEKIIPKEFFVSVELDKNDLLRAVKLAGVFARDASNVIKLRTEKNSLVVSSESGQSGSQETKIDAKIESGDTNQESGKKEFEISFNFKFLEDFLGSVKGENIRMEFTTPDKAGVFRDLSVKNYLHLIMPVRV